MRGKGRGGARTGKVGVAYSNRTDLNGGKLPVATGPSQEYGSRVAQQRAQQALPMGATPNVAPQQGPPDLSSLGMPEGAPLPGSLPPLSAPTERPNESVMAGVNSAPSPVNLSQPHPLVVAATALNSLGGLADGQAKALRDAINATLSNQATP